MAQRLRIIWFVPQHLVMVDIKQYLLEHLEF